MTTETAVSGSNADERMGSVEVAFHSAIAWREYAARLEEVMLASGLSVQRVASDELRTVPPDATLAA